eukprot:CAMPEP_0206533520 /NCGR_PEP_ID=MMETSP0325_2-20121206/5005_1 /ASSEMBLY_ACC=CAM_ASM_000347 /TAXON_ID=2866 /ORGANISM="Crypthecodinium cohnii, Strain Seligo" /LENGTH=881 /DNA_ID=CAMNT_0054030161 /DNA_START=149 /DNA_END=2791 /DNA_ORIENTATION=-
MSWLAATAKHTELNASIIRCKSARELEELVKRIGASANLTNTITILHRYATVARGSAKSEQVQNLHKRLALVLTDRNQIAKVDSQSLANVAWSVARLKLPPQPLLPIVADKIARSASTTPLENEESTHDVSSFARALQCPLGNGDVQCPERSFDFGCLRTVSNSAGQLQRTARLEPAVVMAKVNCKDPKAWDILDGVEKRVPEMAPQHLANVTWALVRAPGGPPPTLIQALGLRAAERPDDLKPQEACNIVWGLAKMQVRGSWVEGVTAKLSRSLQARIESCNMQDHANLVWSIARLQANLPDCLEAFSNSAASRVAKTDWRHLSAMVWAFSTLSEQAPTLFRAVRHELDLEERCQTLIPQQVANISWAFAKQGDPLTSPAFFRRASALLENYQPQELSALLFSSGADEGGLQHRVADAIKQRLPEFGAGDLAGVASNVMLARFNDDELQERLWIRCHEYGWHNFETKELVVLVLALTSAANYATVLSLQATHRMATAAEAMMEAVFSKHSLFTADEACAILGTYTRIKDKEAPLDTRAHPLLERVRTALLQKELPFVAVVQALHALGRLGLVEDRATVAAAETLLAKNLPQKGLGPAASINIQGPGASQEPAAAVAASQPSGPAPLSSSPSPSSSSSSSPSSSSSSRADPAGTRLLVSPIQKLDGQVLASLALALARAGHPREDSLRRLTTALFVEGAVRAEAGRSLDGGIATSTSPAGTSSSSSSSLPSTTPPTTITTRTTTTTTTTIAKPSAKAASSWHLSSRDLAHLAFAWALCGRPLPRSGPVDDLLRAAFEQAQALDGDVVRSYGTSPEMAEAGLTQLYVASLARTILGAPGGPSLSHEHLLRAAANAEGNEARTIGTAVSRFANEVQACLRVLR